MIWTVDVFAVIAIGLIYGLFSFLRSTLARVGSNKSSAYRLGLAALPLILGGIVAFDLRDSILVNGDSLSPTRWLLKSCMENFSWLLIDSGLIFLFILLCVSLSRPNGKSNDKPENPVSEYLR